MVAGVGAALEPAPVSPSDGEASALAGATGDDKTPPPIEGIVQASLWDLFRQWVFLGWTAFGGPSAHIALFQKVCGMCVFATCMSCFWNVETGCVDCNVYVMYVLEHGTACVS